MRETGLKRNFSGIGKIWLLAATLALAGCHDAITPHVSTEFEVKRNEEGRVAMKLDVRNDADRPTVPLLVEVDAFETDVPEGNKPLPVIHPAPFVLNRHESRTLTAELDTPSAVLAQLYVKESERGILLKSVTKTVEPKAVLTPSPESPEPPSK